MDEGTTATVDAPVSTPAAPVSTPSTPAAEPSPTTDRPPIDRALKVFREAEAQQKRARTKSDITPTGEPSAEVAPTTPAEGTQSPPATPKPGYMLVADHIKANENVRTKARADFEQQYGEVIKWANKAATDRVGFLREVINEALQDPTLAPQIASLAGQTLKGRGSSTATDEAPRPDFQDANGNQFYSAKAQQARDEWLIAKVKSEILGDVQPELDQVRSEREQREIAQADYQRSTQITQHLAEAKKTLPYFDKFKADIHAAIAEMPLTDGHPASEMAVLHRAYWQVVGPKLSELEQARVLADLKSRANASSLNPAATGAPTGIPKNVSAKTGGTFADALKWAAAQTAGR